MALIDFSQTVLPALKDEIKRVLSLAKIENNDSLYEILAYHFGWEPGGELNSNQGKRVRPLLVLLTAQASGGKWVEAIPAAASVELLHNFSLIHDDIEDNSTLRRGRVTVWKVYGLPLAINAGDSLYSLSFLGMHRLANYKSPEITNQALKIFSQTCLKLTQGQHLDISFEDMDRISIEQYWQMIEGKTATMLATSTHLGALIAETPLEIQTAYQQMGLNLGLAFQVYDDLLGIWGDPEKTGKSTASDLLTRKKSLPVLFGLQQQREFATLWKQEINIHNVKALADTLREEGGYDYAKEKAQYFTNLALKSYQAAKPIGSAAKALEELIQMLINRSV